MIRPEDLLITIRFDPTENKWLGFAFYGEDQIAATASRCESPRDAADAITSGIVIWIKHQLGLSCPELDATKPDSRMDRPTLKLVR